MSFSFAHDWITAAPWSVGSRSICCYKMLSINEREFLINRGSEGLLRYDVLSQCCTTFLPKILKDLIIHSMEFDRTKQRLFLLCERWKTKRCLTIVYEYRNGSIKHHPYRGGTILFASMVAVNGIIHKIGGMNAVDHMIWNGQEMRWQCNKRQPPFSKFYSEITLASLIHVSSKNMLLMIGGDDDGKDIGIWKYDIGLDIWTQIKELQFEPGPQAVLSSDERFVTIGDRNSVHLWILDIRDDNEYTAKKSVAVPDLDKSRAYCLVRSGGRMESKHIVSGWINRYIRMSIPWDVIEMIAEWYSTEMIHWIARYPGKRMHDRHQMISMDSILFD